MKWLLISLFVFTLLAALAFGQTKYATYNNARFAYSIDYPSALLEMQPESANGDGTTFVSKDNSVELRVWGEYNAAEKTWQEAYDLDLKGLGEKPAYAVLKSEWYVISGTKDGKIHYQKTLRRKLRDGEVFYTFTLEYPESERTKFDAIVRRIARSFKFDPTADV
jgi:hypothetical protein